MTEAKKFDEYNYWLVLGNTADKHGYTDRALVAYQNAATICSPSQFTWARLVCTKIVPVLLKLNRIDTVNAYLTLIDTYQEKFSAGHGKPDPLIGNWVRDIRNKIEESGNIEAT